MRALQRAMAEDAQNEAVLATSTHAGPAASSAATSSSSSSCPFSSPSSGSAVMSDVGADSPARVGGAGVASSKSAGGDDVDSPPDDVAVCYVRSHNREAVRVIVNKLLPKEHRSVKLVSAVPSGGRGGGDGSGGAGRKRPLSEVDPSRLSNIEGGGGSVEGGEGDDDDDDGGGAGSRGSAGSGRGPGRGRRASSLTRGGRVPRCRAGGCIH